MNKINRVTKNGKKHFFDKEKPVCGTTIREIYVGVLDMSEKSFLLNEKNRAFCKRCMKRLKSKRRQRGRSKMYFL